MLAAFTPTLADAGSGTHEGALAFHRRLGGSAAHERLVALRNTQAARRQQMIDNR